MAAPGRAAPGRHLLPRARHAHASPAPHPSPAAAAAAARSARRVLAKLQACNAAARKELDWVGQTEALVDARRVVAHSPELLAQPLLHDLVTAAAPAVEQLRSCTARNALQLLGEMFAGLGPRMDRELDEIVPALIKKAGDVSTAGAAGCGRGEAGACSRRTQPPCAAAARHCVRCRPRRRPAPPAPFRHHHPQTGRDNFLGQEADRALVAMCRACSGPRALVALLASTGARATAARTKVAAHLDGLLDGGGCRCALPQAAAPLSALPKTAGRAPPCTAPQPKLPRFNSNPALPAPRPLPRAMLCANWGLLERLFRASAAFLEEGSLETRTHGKRLLFEVRASVPARADWERLLGALRPEALQRKVLEVLDGPGPPPPPAARGRMGEPAGREGRASAARTALALCRVRALWCWRVCVLCLARLLRAGMLIIRATEVTTDDTWNMVEFLNLSIPAAGLSLCVLLPSCSLPVSPLPSSNAMPACPAHQLTAPARPLHPRPGSRLASRGSPGPASLAGLSSPPSSNSHGAAPIRALFTGGAARRPASPASPEPAGSGGAPGADSIDGLAGNVATALRRRQLCSPRGAAAARLPSPRALGPAVAVQGGSCVAVAPARAVAPPPPPEMSAELAEAVDQVLAHMNSRKWQERVDALRALAALAPAMHAVTVGGLEVLLGSLSARMADANAKVQQQAFEVRGGPRAAGFRREGRAVTAPTGSAPRRWPPHSVCSCWAAQCPASGWIPVPEHHGPQLSTPVPPSGSLLGELYKARTSPPGLPSPHITPPLVALPHPTPIAPNPTLGSQALAALLPAIGDRIGPSLATLVPLLAAGVGSAQAAPRGAAAGALCALCDAGVEPSLLMQHFSLAVCSGPGRGRAALVERLAELSEQVYAGRPDLVVQHALPASFALLQEARADVRAANGRLLAALAALMGPALQDRVAALPSPAAQQRVRDLLAATR
jgi:hypothetical protein